MAQSPNPQPLMPHATAAWLVDNSALSFEQIAEFCGLHILEVQRLMRTMGKVVIAVVNGWAAGGGHSLHVVCDMTLASQHARFKQTDADVGSFDAGYGSAYLAKQVGNKFAREIFFLGQPYTAEEMFHMGAVNRVVDHAELESTAVRLERLWDEVEDCARNGSFHPRRSRLCDWCAFQAQCPLFGGTTPQVPDDGIARLLTARRTAA